MIYIESVYSSSSAVDFNSNPRKKTSVFYLFFSRFINRSISFFNQPHGQGETTIFAERCVGF
jgi:hypothetical protein